MLGYYGRDRGWRAEDGVHWGMSAAGGPRMVCGHGHPCWDTLSTGVLRPPMLMQHTASMV
eukprot:scaffold165616_cov58-Attheya_sp.AAC.3